MRVVNKINSSMLLDSLNVSFLVKGILLTTVLYFVFYYLVVSSYSMMINDL